MFGSKAIVLSAFSLVFSAGAAHAQLQFGAAVSYATPTRPSGMTAADLDGDGIIDLAVTTDNPDRVTILLGTGRGQFSAPIRHTIPSGNGLGALTSGDFDGNGTVDLAVVMKNTARIALMLNNGAGHFILGALETVGARPVDITAADIDGNGSLDLVTANRDGDSISVLRNDGPAGFTVETISTGASSEPRSVALGDLDGNGTLDMVVALHDSRAVATLLNTRGVFGNAVNTAVADDERPEGVAIADINNDGFLDVLVTVGDSDISGNFVGVFSGNGTGVLRNSRLYSTNGLNSSRIASADFDIDGFDDVVVTNEDGATLSLLRGTATGLSTPLLLNVGTHPDGIIAADLNADGRADIACSNRDSDNTSVLLSSFGRGCSGDFNNDGSVDFSDYLDFVDLFAVAAPAADVNMDGVVDFSDYLDFIASFTAGC